MEQSDINQQVFARLTVQNMLLEQLYAAFFAGMADNGTSFMDGFLRNLRYKMNTPAAAHPDCGIDPQQLQADALVIAEHFFSAVKKRTGSL